MLWDFIFTFVLSWGINWFNPPVEDAKPQPNAFLSMHVGDKLSELPPETIKILNHSEHWDYPISNAEGWHHYYEVKMGKNTQGHYKVTLDQKYKILAIDEDWSYEDWSQIQAHKSVKELKEEKDQKQWDELMRQQQEVIDNMQKQVNAASATIDYMH